MQLDMLQIFCDVVQSNSFSKGAAKNGVTQACASQSINKLESYFGAVMIDRSNRPWKITEVGQACYEQSLKVLESFDCLERTVHNIVSKDAGIVKAATIYSVGFAYMPYIKSLYQRQNPEDKLNIDYLHPMAVIDQVNENVIDLGVIAFPEKVKGDFTIIPWKKERMVVVVSPNHKLAAKNRINIEELNNCQMISFDNDILIGREISKLFDDNSISVEVIQRFDNIEAIKRAIEDSRSAIAVLPVTTLKREVNIGSLTYLEFNDILFYRPLGIIYRKGRIIPVAMQKFIDLLTDNNEK